MQIAQMMRISLSSSGCGTAGTFAPPSIPKRKLRKLQMKKQNNATTK